jgi:hypothetical protein
MKRDRAPMARRILSLGRVWPLPSRPPQPRRGLVRARSLWRMGHLLQNETSSASPQLPKACRALRSTFLTGVKAPILLVIDHRVLDQDAG